MGRIIHYGIVLMLIAVISAGILATVNEKTKDKIAQIDKNKELIARKIVFPLGEDFRENENQIIDGISFLPVYKNNSKIGYVISTAYPGYAGDIKFVFGADIQGEITGLKVIASQETPGLGAKINNSEWQKIWIGRNKEYEFDKSIDAFAGATISPEAVYNGMKQALEKLESIQK